MIDTPPADMASADLASADLASADLASAGPLSDGYPLDLLSPEELTAPPGSVRLGIRHTDSGEAGVFSVRRIPAGRLVESCHVLTLSEEETTVLLATSLAGRLVEWPTGDGLRFGSRLRYGSGLLTGSGAVYRHAADPNAFFVADPAAGVARLFSTREILPGHEIHVDRLHGALRIPRSSC
jgi:hypothetical protein